MLALQHVAWKRRRAKAAEYAKRSHAPESKRVRDLNFMRDRLGWEFHYDRAARKYRCTKAPTPTL